MAPSFDCCVNASFHKGKPVGSEGKLGKLDCYITGPETSSKAILMIHDVWGWSLTNTRVLADKYAEGIGARVYLPDYYEGGDLNQAFEKDPKLDRGAFVPALIKKYPMREPAWESTSQSIRDIKHVQKSVKKIGTMGFCWGGTSGLYLSSKEAGDAQVDAIAFGHPSMIESSDFERLARPGLFLTCQNDTMFPKEKQEASKLICEKKAQDGIFTRFSYYPRVAHGWTIKGDETEEYSAKAMTHAATEVIGFFSTELN